MKQIEELVCLEMLLDFGNVKVTFFFFSHCKICNSLHILTDLILLCNLQMAINSDCLFLPPVSSCGRQWAFSGAPGSCETADCGGCLQLKTDLHQRLPPPLQRPVDHLLEEVLDIQSFLQNGVTAIGCFSLAH